VAFSPEYRLHLKALFAAVIAVQLQHFADDAASRLTVYMNHQIDSLADLRFNVRKGRLGVTAEDEVRKAP
jgi:hypothetical protein